MLSMKTELSNEISEVGKCLTKAIQAALSSSTDNLNKKVDAVIAKGTSSSSSTDVAKFDDDDGDTCMNITSKLNKSISKSHAERGGGPKY